MIIPTPIVITLALLSIGLGWFLQRQRVPAAYLIAGIVISGTLHLSETVMRNLPDAFITASLIVLEDLIGTRCNGIKLAELVDAVWAGLMVAAIAIIGVTPAVFLSLFFWIETRIYFWFRLQPAGLRQWPLLQQILV